MHRRDGDRPSGIVYLVGAGPGDPGLLTRRALDLIAAADAILYDRLVPSGALDGARPDADLRYVGKRPGAPSLAQKEINALLVELARAGRRGTRPLLLKHAPKKPDHGNEHYQAETINFQPTTRDDRESSGSSGDLCGASGTAG